VSLDRLTDLQRDVWRTPTKSHAADWLLRYGRLYPGRRLPACYRDLAGPRGLCFRNSAEAAVADAGLHYAEGMIEVDEQIESHAWCVDDAGEVVELTLPTAHGATGWRYWGVLLDPEVVLDFLDAVGVHSAGMLGQLKFDASLLRRRVPLGDLTGAVR